MARRNNVNEIIDEFENGRLKPMRPIRERSIPLRINEDVDLDRGFARYLSQIRYRMSFNRGGNSNVSVRAMTRLYSDVDLEIQQNNLEFSGVELKLRKSDLYLIGFKKRNGLLYEFNSDSGPLFDNSLIMPYSESYTDLLGNSIHNLEVGYHPLRKAAKCLIETDHQNAWKPCLGLIAVTLCETARFANISNIIHRLLRTKTQERLEPWAAVMFRSWSAMSEEALQNVSVVPRRLTPHQLAALKFLEKPGRFARVCLRVYHFPK